MGFAFFSDLDGTPLDHETYRFDAALPALNELRRKRIPLVLASSKTAAEIAAIRDAIGFADYPAIVENGTGILSPGLTEVKGESREIDKILAILGTAPNEISRYFRGFSKMTVNEIAALTGLPPDAAAKAAMRQFSEPGVWSGTSTQLERFRSWLAERKIAVRRGGRFDTLSFGATKADRMAQILEDIRARSGEPVVSVALGDAPNDIEMLEAADRAFIVANPCGAQVPELEGERSGAIMRSQRAGPEGWNDAVLSILNG